MSTRPKPSGERPNIAVYERRESKVRSYARAIPREFSSASGPWMLDSKGGAVSRFSRRMLLA